MGRSTLRANQPAIRRKAASCFGTLARAERGSRIRHGHVGVAERIATAARIGDVKHHLEALLGRLIIDGVPGLGVETQDRARRLEVGNVAVREANVAVAFVELHRVCENDSASVRPSGSPILMPIEIGCTFMAGPLLDNDAPSNTRRFDPVTGESTAVIE